MPQTTVGEDPRRGRGHSAATASGSSGVTQPAMLSPDAHCSTRGWRRDHRPSTIIAVAALGHPRIITDPREPKLTSLHLRVHLHVHLHVHKDLVHGTCACGRRCKYQRLSRRSVRATKETDPLRSDMMFGGGWLRERQARTIVISDDQPNRDQPRHRCRCAAHSLTSRTGAPRCSADRRGQAQVTTSYTLSAGAASRRSAISCFRTVRWRSCSTVRSGVRDSAMNSSVTYPSRMISVTVRSR